MKKPPHKTTQHLRARGERQRDPIRETVAAGGLPVDATLEERRDMVSDAMAKVIRRD